MTLFFYTSVTLVAIACVFNCLCNFCIDLLQMFLILQLSFDWFPLSMCV